jgi:lysophospholipid acyltransferase (LPLAT)-like uncharacterized protein
MGRLLSLLVRMLAWTWRVQADPLPQGPVVLALWHGHLLAALGVYRDQRATAAVSLSEDGELLANALAHLGVQTARGSSSRGALALSRALTRALKADERVVLAVDGPRGPAGQVQPGALHLSSTTGAPLVCLQVSASPAIRLRTWDRFLIPLPFSRVVLRCQPAGQEPDGIRKVLASAP